MPYTGKGAAKINLTLDVLRKRPDGYHDVMMIMQSVALYDILTVKANRDEIKLTSNASNIPLNKTNIVYKAAEYLKSKYNVKGGAAIHIEKNIPVAAGLAGGSTDAAAALKLLDKAWDLKLTRNELLEAARKLGADVTFCLQGGTALAEGLGEKLTPMKSMPDCHILLAKPEASISTREVYQNFRLDAVVKKPDTKGMTAAIQDGNIYRIAENLCNVLETVTIKMCPEIETIKQKLLDYGALGSLMSGSGPTVFGLFEDMNAAYKAYDSIKDMVREIFVVKTADRGDD
ncbi:MAG: 4-(cytidine 5'-diphospho)-2-C-methyl-D-erythritol kinase [Bacillota bacterium]